jgi:hypothetical protein
MTRKESFCTPRLLSTLGSQLAEHLKKQAFSVKYASRELGQASTYAVIMSAVTM